MKFKTIRNIFNLNNIEKAYTEGIYADTPANRKLGRVGMSYEEWNNKNKGNTEADMWASAIKYKEDRELAKKAAEIILKLGVKLPKLEHKPIPKQYNFRPICGFYKDSNTIVVNSSLNITKKGKEYKEKGWNVQDNPILHELSHYLAYKMDPNGYNKKEFDSLKEGDRDIISKEVSTYASWNQRDFNAELISGILSGKKFSENIMKFSNLKLNLKGKTPEEILAPGIEFYHKLESLSERINKRINPVSKAYTEGIYADTPANRKLGRVGMTYAAYAEKIKNDKEEKADKKYWLIQYNSGEEDIFTEDKMSKEKLIEEVYKFAKEIAEANDYDEYKFDIQENTDDWKEEDFDKKQYDWLSVKAKKHNGKYEVSIYDWRDGKYIINDRQKRENKNFQQKIKRDKEKSEKEFKEKFGWMEEFLKYKEQQKTNPVNEKMKKTIQNFLRDKDINSFQLGYGGYLFSNKDSKGNYGRLSLSMIREQDLESIKEMLHEENIDYKVENKIMSSQKGMIKDVSIIFNNKEQKNDKQTLKEKQLEIVKKYNPHNDSLGNHTWIKSIDDIKTLDEMLGENEEDEFVYPDFTPKDAHLASAKGKLIIYSSYPITEGVFVSPSKMCAQDYAGGEKIYSKEVNVKDIAWIDGGQGQYTPIKD